MWMFTIVFYFSQSQEISSKHQGALPSRDLRPSRTNHPVRVLRLWKVSLPPWSQWKMSAKYFGSKCVTCPTLNLCVLLTCIFFVSPWVSFYVSSHSPVPKLRWRKVDGLMPSKAGLSAEAPTLILPELSFDDEGVYECEAYNSEGSDTHQGRINVQGTVDILWISGGVATEHIPVTITWRQ